MARKKKRKKGGRIQPSKKTGNPFNPALKGNVTLSQDNAEPIALSDQKATSADHGLHNDEMIFKEAMADVRPLEAPRNRLLALPRIDIEPAHPAPNDELEVMTHLSELVSGSTQLDITYSDEYVEGCVPGFSPKLMQRLKRGQFPIQSYTDLHGFTKQEAQIRVRDFIVTSYQSGLRCVLVIHGRGLNSENRMPVLKEQLPLWLTHGPIRRIVLAFSTARSYDGGTGALYILLRKKKGVL